MVSPESSRIVVEKLEMKIVVSNIGELGNYFSLNICPRITVQCHPYKGKAM
jgi:hypothetical protein